MDAPESLNDIGFTSPKLATEFTEDLRMGDSHALEINLTRGSRMGKKKKRKVKKKVKRNLVPPSKQSFITGEEAENMFDGHTQEQIRDYYLTLDRIYQLNPQAKEGHIDLMIPWLEKIQPKVAELKLETLRLLVKEAVDRPPELK